MNTRREENHGDQNDVVDQDDQKSQTEDDNGQNDSELDESDSDGGQSNKKPRTDEKDLIIRRMKADLNKARAKLAEIDRNQSLSEREKAKREGKLEVVVKSLESQLNAAIQDNTTLQSKLERNLKFNIFRNSALKAGWRQDALAELERLDLDDLHYEENENGIGRVIGIDGFINKLKKEKSYFFTDKKVNVNNSGGRKKQDIVTDESAEVSMEDIKKALRQGNTKLYNKLLAKHAEQFRNKRR